MKKLLLISILSISGCTSDVNVSDSYHHIVIDNPIIEFCERLYPDTLYPDPFEQDSLIVHCMSLCSDSNSCSVDLDQLNLLEEGF